MLRTEQFPSRQGFVVDPDSITRHHGRQISWEDVPRSFTLGGSVVTVDTGGAAQAATAVPVKALTQALPKGTVLDFGAAGKLAELSADAAVGATSLAVDALPTALVAGDQAQVTGDPKTAYGAGAYKSIPAGTVMTQLLTGANAGKLVPRAARPAGNTDPATCILETNANESNGFFSNDSLTGYGCILGGVLFENLLPDADPATGLLPTAFKTELQTAGVGTGFAWQKYRDSRAG